MRNKRGKKLDKKGSLYPQSSNRVKEKRFMKGNYQRIPAAPVYAFAPAEPNVPAYAIGLHSTGNLGTVQGDSIPCVDQGPGYIFMCNGKTKADCYKYRVFGLPAARMDILEKIKPHMKLFLFDFDLKLLYGVYIAASNGSLSIEPAAFGGKFSAQVRFDIFKDCLPLPESSFKRAIADNYKGGSKFRQELSNEQVATLMSLFRPVADLSTGTGSSLMSNTIHPATIVPRSIEIRTRPATELSSSYDQYLARLQISRAGATSDFRHGHQVGPSLPPAAHVPMEDMANLQSRLVSQPRFDQFYPPEAHKAYIPENPVLHSRYTAVPNDTEKVIVKQTEPTYNYYNHEAVLGSTTTAPVQAHPQFSTSEHEHLPSSSQTAAYWVQVASADPTQVYYTPYQWISSESTGLGGQNVPVTSSVAAQAYPAVQESKDGVIVQQSSTVHDYNQNITLAATNAHAPTESVTPPLQVPSRGPAHMSASFSGAVYSVAPTSQYLAHVYTGQYQGLPSGGTGFVAGNASVSLSEAAPGYAAEPDKSHMENVSQLGYPYGYHQNLAVSSANIPLQAHSQLPSQVPAHLHGYAHSLSSSRTAAYWTGVAYEDPSQMYLDPHQLSSRNTAAYNHNVVVSATNAPLQPHAYVQSQVPAASQPSASEVDAQGKAVNSEDPSQVYYS